IVGMAYTAQLLVAKVVKPDGSIPLEAEAAAIRWAANAGARGIKLRLGGERGGAVDQPRPRRRPRSGAQGPRHVPRRRGERRRIRVRERRSARGGRGERRRGVLGALAVRKLSGRAPARDRSERTDSHGKRAHV